MCGPADLKAFLVVVCLRIFSVFDLTIVCIMCIIVMNLPEKKRLAKFHAQEMTSYVGMPYTLSN